MDKWLSEHIDDIINDTVNLLKIRSVKDAPSPGAPFGTGIRQALDYTLSVAQRLGFKTHNNDGYYGYAEAGEGSPCLGILTHLDVVPEGTGWTYPPYDATVIDGKIYARGAIDDKSPAIAALYAAKAAEMRGFTGRVRIIFGCDEESGWGCMKKYAACEQLPDFAFTPDAEYPLINTEKNILHLNLKTRFENKYNVTLAGGTRPNVVPGSAVLTADNPQILANCQNAGATREGQCMHFAGKSAHASRVELGKNALFAPIDVLARYFNEFALISQKLSGKIHCEGLGLETEDAQSGKLTVNLGLLSVKGDEISLVLDFRMPLNVSFEQVLSAVESNFPGFDISILSRQPSHHVPPDSKLVKTLLAAYRDITGFEAAPKYTGGGTYARAFPGAVAFGPLLPGRPDLAHQPDEHIAIDDLALNARIFAHAIAKLLS
ncbi:MAG TPA: Sapep family Mn(2+)-dependent dipeptidase [Clostridia bacterium]|nr:Sapep family Mn(2+)-dependent dipeptidase [Clostridia bacterium]